MPDVALTVTDPINISLEVAVPDLVLDLNTVPAIISTNSAIIWAADASGSPLSAGAIGFIQIPHTCVITSWTLIGDATGSVVVDVYKGQLADIPTLSVVDKITGSAKPTITAAQYATSSTLTGWDTLINEGDVLKFNIDSVSSFTRLTIVLNVTKQ